MTTPQIADLWRSRDNNKIVIIVDVTRQAVYYSKDGSASKLGMGRGMFLSIYEKVS